MGPHLILKFPLILQGINEAKSLSGSQAPDSAEQVLPAITLLVFMVIRATRIISTLIQMNAAGNVLKWATYPTIAGPARTPR